MDTGEGPATASNLSEVRCSVGQAREVLREVRCNGSSRIRIYAGHASTAAIQFVGKAKPAMIITLHPYRVKTEVSFSAEDPWNQSRLAQFTLDDYILPSIFFAKPGFRKHLLRIRKLSAWPSNALLTDMTFSTATLQACLSHSETVMAEKRDYRKPSV